MEEKGNITLVPTNVENDDSGNKIEIYRKEEVPKEEKGGFDVKTNVVMKKHSELCSELGLETQAKFCEKEVGKAEYANRFYPMLSKYELNILRQFLPKTYSKNKGEWKQYQFDIVPTKVLEEISTADSLQIFDDLKIWTPERIAKDPIVIGEIVENPGVTDYITRGKYFVISRWGEALKSFEDIVNDVISRFITSNSWHKIPSEKIRNIMHMIIQESFKNGIFATHKYAGKVKARHCGKSMHYVRMYSAVWYMGLPQLYFLICEECGSYTHTKKSPKRSVGTLLKDIYYYDSGFSGF